MLHIQYWIFPFKTKHCPLSRNISRSCSPRSNLWSRRPEHGSQFTRCSWLCWLLLPLLLVLSGWHDLFALSPVVYRNHIWVSHVETLSILKDRLREGIGYILGTNLTDSMTIIREMVNFRKIYTPQIPYLRANLRKFFEFMIIYLFAFVVSSECPVVHNSISPILYTYCFVSRDWCVRLEVVNL